VPGTPRHTAGPAAVICSAGEVRCKRLQLVVWDREDTRGPPRPREVAIGAEAPSSWQRRMDLTTRSPVLQSVCAREDMAGPRYAVLKQPAVQLSQGAPCGVA